MENEVQDKTKLSKDAKISKNLRNNTNLITVLIVFIILVVVVVLYWDRQQKRVFQQSQSMIQADLLEEWGPGSQLQIQRSLQARPAAFSKQVSYKNIIARIASSVVSVNVDTSIFNNAAQQAKIQPMAQTLGMELTTPGQDMLLQNFWGARMGGFGTGSTGNMVCPNCGTTMPHQRGVPAYTINCPNCQTPMMLQGASRICRIPAQIQQIATQNTPATQAPNTSHSIVTPNRIWLCPNCYTSMPCRQNTIASLNCPSCGILMTQADSQRYCPVPPQTQSLTTQNQLVDQSLGSEGIAQYVWGGTMGGLGSGVGGYWCCPNCYTSMPCRQNAIAPLNCPSCGMLMARGGPSWNYSAPRQAADGQQPAQQQQNIQQFQAAGRGGSGVIVNSNGYVLTNHHVIHGAKKIAVTVYTGQTSKTYQASLIDEAPELDFAILKIISNGEIFTSAPIGNSSLVSVGDEVLAIGSPFGLPQTTTFGIVSNTKRTMTVGKQTYTDFIQTDAPINPGSSGGALVNINGEVIGINTAIYSPTRAFSGIGFARPIDSAKAAFPDFIRTTDRQITQVAFQQGLGLYPWCPPGGQMRQVANTQEGQPWLGIRTYSVDRQTKASLALPMTRGVVVSEIFANSPCLAAGLQTGDVIVRVDNRSLKDEAMLGSIMADKNIGDQIKLAIYRNGKKSNFQISLGPRPGGIQTQPVGLLSEMPESLSLQKM